MKRVLFFMLLLVTESTFAGWTYLTKNGTGDSFYVDYSTFKKGVKPKIWMLSDYGTVSQYGDRSFIVLVEADCRDGRLRFLSEKYHTGQMGSGNVSSSYSSPSGWNHAAPGSVTSTFTK